MTRIEDLEAQLKNASRLLDLANKVEKAKEEKQRARSKADAAIAAYEKKYGKKYTR